MNNLENIDNKLNKIVDRYVKLGLSLKNIKKYLLGKNIKIVLDEIPELESSYLIKNKDKTRKDFIKLVKDKLRNILRDRLYYFKDMKTFEKFDIDYIDPYGEENWDEIDDMTFGEWAKVRYKDRNYDNINFVDCSRSNISSLDGIEEFKNIEFLTCKFNNIEDISIINNLKKLTNCNFTNNDIKGDVIIKNLDKLETIMLNNNSIDTITLNNLPSLKVVMVTNNGLKHINIDKVTSDSIDVFWATNNELDPGNVEELKSLLGDKIMI
jgi:hypothetical protein